MGRKKLGVITQKKTQTFPIKKPETKENENIINPGSKKESKKKVLQPEKNNSKKKVSKLDLKDGDFDLSDLEMTGGLDLNDFEDPEYYSSEEELEDEEGFYPENSAEMMFDLFNNFLEYDNQNAVEVLCQIRDSVDANSKCLLRMANELRNLQRAYIHIQSLKQTPNKSRDEESESSPQETPQETPESDESETSEQQIE